LGGTYAKVEQETKAQRSDIHGALHTTASLGEGNPSRTWPVEIRMIDGGLFEVCAEATRMELHITKVPEGYLVSVPNFHCCGIVPAKFGVNAYDVMEYAKIENRVDATSLAAAISLLVNDDPNVDKIKKVQQAKEWLRNRMDASHCNAGQISRDLGLSRSVICRFLSSELPPSFAYSVATSVAKYRLFLEGVGLI